MKEIKTKGRKKDIHALDKSAELSAKMKKGLSHAKNQAQNLSDDRQATPDEYAQDKVKYALEDIAHDVAHGSKETVQKGYDGSKRFVQQINQKRCDADSIKQTAKSTGRQTFKTMERNIKTAGQSMQRNVKTAEQTARTTIKTTEKAAKSAQQTVKATEKTAKASAKAAKKSAQAARKTAEKAAQAAKTTVKATISAVKAIIAGIKTLIVAIAAGGWVAVVIIIVIVMVALIIGSGFGIFYSPGDTNGLTMQSAISEINAEYQMKIEKMKNSTSHDLLEIQGGNARWQDVLAVYAIKTTTDHNNAQEVATMDEKKRDILKGVFWDMHELSKRTETKKVKEYTETADENGDIVVTEKEVSKTVLYISVKHTTIDEMKTKYGFNADQNAQLDELLTEDKAKLWSNVLYEFGSNDIVSVARSQLGNSGGQPYWSWYGFGSRIEWCACFVSWCANECGYIETGVIPKFAGCQNAVNWFLERGQWQDRSYTPKEGDIIFFDWGYNGYTGTADHVGIVEKVVGNTIYTIEGNSGDQCKEQIYEIGYDEILGFGVPAY